MTALLVIFGVLTLTGLVLSARALLPKRTGETPYCRKCGYNLTGTDLGAGDARCPECGSELTSAKAVLRGELRRRPGRVILASACLLVGLVPLVIGGVKTLRGVDWYQYKPTKWVLRDINGADANLASKALNEMMRRWRVRELVREDFVGLAEACLAEQARPVVRRSVSFYAGLVLYALHQRNGLSAEQLERLFTNMVSLSAEVRPVVRRGQPWYAGIRVDERAAHDRYWVDCQIDLIRVGDPAFCWISPDESKRLRESSGCSLGSAQEGISKVGEHAVTLEVTVQVHERVERPATDSSPFRSFSAGRMLCSDQRTLTSHVVVLGEELPDPLRLEHGPEMDKAIAEAVFVTEFEAGPVLEFGDRSGEAGEQIIRGRVEFACSLPIGLAVDVFVDMHGQRFATGAITRRPAEWTDGQAVWLCLRETIADRVTLILRTNRAVALNTPDIFHVWDGELRFEDIPVRRVEEGVDLWARAVRGHYAGDVRRRDLTEGESVWPASPHPRWVHAIRRSDRLVGGSIGNIGGADPTMEAVLEILGRLETGEPIDDRMFQLIDEIRASGDGAEHSGVRKPQLAEED